MQSKESSTKPPNAPTNEDEVEELSKMVEKLESQFHQLQAHFRTNSEPDLKDADTKDEELEKQEIEKRANPWIWSGPRKPNPVNPKYYQKLMEKNPPTNVKSLLQKVLVQDIAYLNWVKKRPVLISAKHSIERGLYKIMQHNVHSLPVVDNNGEIFGVIDVEDLARPIITMLKEDPLTGVIRVNNDVMGRPVSSLFITQEKKTYLISNQTTLWSALGHFLRLDVRRFLIVDRPIYEEVREQTFPEAKIDGLLTQSDIFRFLSSNVTWMKSEPLLVKSLSELKLGTTVPVVINSQEFAGTAFSILRQHRRTNAAIVDSKGTLISTLSVSDLKGLNRKNSYVLNLTIENFFMHDKKKDWWEKPSVVDLSVSLYETIMQFNCSRRHVVFLVDDNNRPVGEVNQQDVLTKLMALS
jgi:CBS domain-containing protein